MVSGYSTRSDLKASRVDADTVLAGRMFHSSIILGKYEFASTSQLRLSVIVTPSYLLASTTSRCVAMESVLGL